MRTTLLCGAAAFAFLIAGAASAATPPAPDPTEPAASAPLGGSVNPPASATPPAATPPAVATTTAPTGAAADTAAAATAPAPLTAGLSVKDNTGATIGQVTEIKADAAGKQMATIKMGADTFQVAASSLAVATGAATINLTQAQIQDMIHKH